MDKMIKQIKFIAEGFFSKLLSPKAFIKINTTNYELH